MNAEEFRTMLDIHAEPEDGKYPTLDDYSEAMRSVDWVGMESELGEQELSWWARNSSEEKLNIGFAVFLFISVTALWVVIHFNLDGHG